MHQHRYRPHVSRSYNNAVSYILYLRENTGLRGSMKISPNWIKINLRHFYYRKRNCCAALMEDTICNNLCKLRILFIGSVIDIWPFYFEIRIPQSPSLSCMCLPFLWPWLLIFKLHKFLVCIVLRKYSIITKVEDGMIIVIQSSVSSPFTVFKNRATNAAVES